MNKEELLRKIEGNYFVRGYIKALLHLETDSQDVVLANTYKITTSAAFVIQKHMCAKC